MALNRRQRRARADRRPYVGDTPQQQMKALLKQPGKFHIVNLPDQKSFVVKVTDREMPLFLTICGQLKGVLGHCEVTAATPVDATVADAGMIARQTSNDPVRLKLAQDRTDAADEAEIDASMARHPAGKKRPAGGRHAKPEPDTVFDQLTSGTDERRLAAMELAAAQDAARAASDALDAANARLAEVYERSGELHNRHVLDKFTEQAGEAISVKLGTATAAELCGEPVRECSNPECPGCTCSIAPPCSHCVDHGCSLPVGHDDECLYRYTPDDGPEYQLGRDIVLGDRYPAPEPDRIDNIDTARQSAIDEALRQAHANANPDGTTE
ncbi:hypothetical protein H7J86_26215 [Mycobacterium hackensackense]|uniref:hypothetical protein n=1 Tax=Mycobacterium hackensackense TaxID=228909 RepID=UPI002265D003|nr:hypothetical protein [Mycobacterium hackensackense]MCV7255664.1 hypothetical protein [Mycobacterium hackensackense]